MDFDDTHVFYLLEPLLYFVNNAKINITRSNMSFNLFDLFPPLKQGYTMSDVIPRLLSTYCVSNNLITDGLITPDELIQKVLNGKIYPISDRKDITTFDIIKISDDKFDNNFFPDYRLV